MSLLAGLLLFQPVPDPIIVTGRGLPQAEIGEHHVQIDRARLSASPSGRMEDIVRSVAGLTSFRRSDARSTHPTAQGLTARGLGGNAASRFAVEVDGVPQSDPFGGWINFTALDPNLADEVRITRGGQGGVRFGPGAVAGTLTIDTLADTITRGGIAYGSRDSLSLWGSSGADLGDARLLAGAAFDRGDGFIPVTEAGRGAADHAAPYRQASGRMRLLVPVGGAELQASLSAFDDRRTRGVDFTTNHGKGLDAALRVVGRDWSLVGYAQQRRFDSQFASVGAGRATVTPSLDQYHVPASGWGLKGQWQPQLGAAKLALGTDLRAARGTTHERYSYSAGAFRRERSAGAESLTAGLFADADARLGAVELGGGVRVDRWSIRDATLQEQVIGGAALTNAAYPDRHGLQWSGRAALSAKPGDPLTLRAAAYRSWRLPTINELVRPFRVGPDATAANAALNPERLLGVEAGFDWTPSRQTRFSLTAYANRLKDAVTNVTLGHGPGLFPGVGFVSAAGLYRQRLNVDAIDARGVEADGEWRRGSWSLGGSVALTHARLRATGLAAALDGKRPAQMPAVQGNVRIGWDEKGRLATLTLRYVGQQDEAEGDAKPLPHAFTADAVLRWPIMRHLSLDLRGENLLNRQIITSILADDTRERATPRTLWIGLRFN